MSSYRSHIKHSRERDRDGDGDRDRDRDSKHHQHHHSKDRSDGRGRESSRDGRDREHRSKHADTRDGRSGQLTPTKAPAAAAAAPPAAAAKPAAMRGFLGGSVLEAAKAEAAKRKAAEAAAAAAAAAGGGGDGGGDDAEDGELGEVMPRKRPKHAPIVWQSPPRDAGDSRPSTHQVTLQERLQREAAEFRQQQQQQVGRPSSRQHRPSSRARSRSSSRSSGSRSLDPSPASDLQDGRQRPRQRRRHSSSSRSSSGGSSRSRSRSGDGRGRLGAAAGARWQQEEAEDDEQQPQKQQGRSRWNIDEEGDEGKQRRGGDGGDVEEGEAVGAVGAALDEELEELNRRERAALDAGEGDGKGSGGSPSRSEVLRHEGLALHHDMLKEARRVEEYEKLNRISEGTYGVVFRARCKTSGNIFALKKLKMENCPDGFPQTSVREVNVLLSLHHPNIVNVPEVVVGGRDGIFMVMEYVEHDLKYVMELQKAKKAQQFSIGQVKCLMQQLLEGVAFLHHSWVLHRDLKTSNLLYSNSGQLKICDFGLARQYGEPLSPYTPMVVTLWYRAIERLLGDPKYDTALDMWSVGCIMAELLLGEPLFPGKGELDQMKKIFNLLGTPTQESWPGWDQLPECKILTWKPEESKLRQKFPTVFFGGSAPVLSDAGFDLLSRLLEMNPAKRITADEALRHRWFSETPRPVSPALMPTFTPRHQQSSANDYKL